jgi:AraC family transcriptional regulator
LISAIQPVAEPAKLYRARQLQWYAERVEAARITLEREFAEPQALGSLARRVGMSTFQFARIFRELVGTPPHRYLLRIRLNQARELLRSGLSVTRACYDCGFMNLSHFTRSFQGHFGYLPSAANKAAK